MAGVCFFVSDNLRTRTHVAIYKKHKERKCINEKKRFSVNVVIHNVNYRQLQYP